MELWDIYDIDRQKTERTMVRGSAFDQGAFHLVVHVCIFDSRGRMLIQQRVHNKETYADFWDITVGGSAIEGDTSSTAAEREVMEELGIELNLEGLRPHISVTFGDGFDDFYLVEKDVRQEDLCFQKEEVQAARWASQEEILQMIEDGSFIPYYKDLIRLLFSMKGRIYSAHSVDND